MAKIYLNKEADNDEDEDSESFSYAKDRGQSLSDTIFKEMEEK